MAQDDEEKTAFYTDQGTYCYTKMLFRLKNVGATYQRLVDTAFQSLIGRNLEAYVDDMVIKSNDEKVPIEDIVETIDNFRRINMKLNPKKCSFGVEEGKFLGYMVTSERIRANPKKTNAITDMQSPRTLKEMQSLSEKLAALKRFLSRSAEKSLPFFETLKDITKENKDECRWTESAEKAFQEMKEVIVELPLLTTPVKEETLYVYVATAAEAVSVVLLAERKGRQCPIHYVSKTLNEANTNYALLENWPCHCCTCPGDYEAIDEDRRKIDGVIENEDHPFKVITDEPLKQILNKARASRKLAKYSMELGAYNIDYEPRNAMKGQVLADFLSEAPGSAWEKNEGSKHRREGGLEASSESDQRKLRGKQHQHDQLATIAFDHLTKKVLVEVLTERSTDRKEVGAIVEEEEDNWMTPIVCCLADDAWPTDKDERRALRMKINQYIL
ncbi:reverse transcriptase domain-containing protein [Tanacetum coccineum]